MIAFTIISTVLGLAIGIAAWMFPDFRHWILPKFGLRADYFDPGRNEHVVSLPLKTSPVEQPLQIQCPLCKGTGNKWARYTDTCHKCNGFGYIYTYRRGQPHCPQCWGTGYKNARYTANCPICDGVGLLPFEHNDRDHMLAPPRSST